MVVVPGATRSLRLQHSHAHATAAHVAHQDCGKTHEHDPNIFSAPVNSMFTVQDVTPVRLVDGEGSHSV